MSQLDAVLFTFQVVMVCMLIVGACVLFTALRYEWQDRRRKRARGGMVRVPSMVERQGPPATISSLEMHRRYRSNRRRGAA